MTTCILHIGMHKTGTSSIQASLAALPDDRGYKLANFGYPNASGAIVGGFQNRSRANRDVAQDALETRRERVRARFKSTLESYKHQNIVISGEAMVHLNADEMNDLIAFIPHTTIKVIGYAREPRSFMSSACQERIKGGMHDLRTAKLFPPYRTLFEKYDGRLPTELYHFDRTRLRNGCVVQDFCAHVGIDITPQEVINKNESISLQATKLLYCWNIWRHTEGLPEGRSWVLPQALAALKDNSFRLATKFTDEAVKQNAAAITWIEHRLGSPFRSEAAIADSVAVSSATELTEPNQEALMWLCQRVGKRFESGMSREKIGLYMQLFYEKSLLASDGKGP